MRISPGSALCEDISSDGSRSPVEDVLVIEVPVKLFVGRFPKSLDDTELMRFFEPFGKIKECVILRDFHSKESKGCAFIKFGSVSDAVDCIKKLNNKLVLDQDIGPLQVQFANGEIERLGLSAEQIEVPPVKIFVGSLPVDFTEQTLFELFAPFGEVVETFILHDESTGTSKGSGFVKMRKKEAAASAIHGLNKAILGSPATVETKPLEVRLAVSKLQRERKMLIQSPRGHNPHKPPPVIRQSDFSPPAVAYFPHVPTIDTMAVSGNLETPKSGPMGCNVFVFHVPPEWTEYHLRQYFSNYGYMVSATIIRDKLSLASKGFGFVSYDNPYSAQSAVLHMNGFMVGGKRLKVQLKRGEMDDKDGYSGLSQQRMYANTGGG